MKLVIWEKSDGWHWEIEERSGPSYYSGIWANMTGITATKWGAKRKGCRNIEKFKKIEELKEADRWLKEKTKEEVGCE